ncbi:hypothetical protein ACIGXM_05445 [Kitasatospora sp. NPDC052896]|uniref:hypothetical protein n=1 Tax=Kitasatospora sp. NPDC052896 TaxID=3364061 RepID=UPI0037C8F158
MPARSSTRRRTRLLAGTAALAIGAGLPLLSAAAAPAAAPTPACPGNATTAGHQGTAASAFLPDQPSSITAGGRPVVIDLEMANLTGADYPRIAPSLLLTGARGADDLRPGDLSVQVMKNGAWQPLPVLPGCDSGLGADTSSLAQRLASGHAARFMFRVALSAKAPAHQNAVTVTSGTGLNDRPNQLTLHVLRH